MLKAVLDSNVLVSAFASPYGTPGRIYNLWLDGSFVFVASNYIIAEFKRIAVDKLSMDVNMVDSGLSFILNNAYVVRPALLTHKNILPNDWPILGTAIAGGADFLVTGDKKILNLKTYRGIGVITPSQFLKIL